MENKTELMQLRHPDYDRELTELVRSNLSPKAFREKLLDYHENDIAAALEALTLSERQRIYHALDAAELSAVLEYAEPMTAYLNELSLRRRVNVLSRMDADAAVDFGKAAGPGLAGEGACVVHRHRLRPGAGRSAQWRKSLFR